MILDNIVADVSIELEKRKSHWPLAEMVKRALSQSPALDFAAALRGDNVRLIAEVKKASPSKGVICPISIHYISPEFMLITALRQSPS